MAVSGPSADRGGIQKPYASGYARGWTRYCGSGGGTGVPLVGKFSHKGLQNLHQTDCKCRFNYVDVNRSCPLKGRSNYRGRWAPLSNGRPMA